MVTVMKKYQKEALYVDSKDTNIGASIQSAFKFATPRGFNSEKYEEYGIMVAKNLLDAFYKLKTENYSISEGDKKEFKKFLLKGFLKGLK